MNKYNRARKSIYFARRWLEEEFTQCRRIKGFLHFLRTSGHLHSRYTSFEFDEKKYTVENLLRIEVTYFSPCEDPESESFGSGRGQYRTAAGIVRKVDTLKRRILVGDQNIDLDTVTALSGNPLLEQISPYETA